MLHTALLILFKQGPTTCPAAALLLVAFLFMSLAALLMRRGMPLAACAPRHGRLLAVGAESFCAVFALVRRITHAVRCND